MRRGRLQEMGRLCPRKDFLQAVNGKLTWKAGTKNTQAIGGSSWRGPQSFKNCLRKLAPGLDRSPPADPASSIQRWPYSPETASWSGTWGDLNFNLTSIKSSLRLRPSSRGSHYSPEGMSPSALHMGLDSNDGRSGEVVQRTAHV